MQCTKTQGYYGNATSVYKENGLSSHGGVDIHCGYGTEIKSPLDGYVYKIIDDKRPANDGTGYWAIFIISEYKGVGELCVGHCSRVDVEVGQYVKKGQVIGLEGNKGTVFAGGERITLEMQQAGDTRGSHRHWQWRSITKTQKFNPKNPKLLAYPFSVYKDDEGYYYEITNFYNGINGLSPLIEEILENYEKGLVENVVVNNIEVSPEVKRTWLSILKGYFELLKNIKNRS